MKANEEKIEHLKLIQQVINRLAGNSFLIKGWTITVVLAGFGFYFSKKENGILVVLLIAIFLFWFSDAYYLRQEKIFRNLYEKAVDGKVKLFSMNPNNHKEGVEDILCVALSFPTSLIYISLIIFLSLILFSVVKI